MPAIAKKGILYTETPSVENRVVEGNQNPVTSGAVYKELGDTSVNNDLGANVSNQIGNLNEEIADIWKANGVLGVKNLIFNQKEGRSGTYNGITFTFNHDGSVSLDGTANANTYIYLWDTNIWANEKFKAGSYKASASLNKSSETTIYFGADKRTASSYIAQYFNIGVNSTVPVEKEVNSDGDYYISYWVNIRSGNTVDNVKIYPMLRYASDTDTTYQPYAMTNYELTQKIADLQAQINALK